MAETLPPASAKWGDLGVRALSAAVLIPAVLADVWAGGIWFHLFVALIGILMAQEWVTIVHRGNPVQFALHAAGAMCGALLPLDVGLGGGLIAIAALSMLSIVLAAYEEQGGPAGAISAFPMSRFRPLPWCCSAKIRTTGLPPSSWSC